MKTVACDLCGSSKTTLLFALPDQQFPTDSQSFRIVECRGCGLIYLNPRPEGEDLAAYYPKEFYDGLEPDRRDRTEQRSSSRRTHRKMRRRALLERFYGYPSSTDAHASRGNRLLSAIKTARLSLERWRLRIGGREAAIIPFVGEGRLLDVGCASGKDLEPFIETGWNVTGVEFNPDAASVTRRRYGIKVLVGEFEQVPFGDERFDVVRFSHTLEHLPSPTRALEKVYRLLQPGGLLWIEVPNAGSADRQLFGTHWFCWDLPRHLYHFTPQTMTRLLGSTGFQPVKMRCDGRTNFFTESVIRVMESRLGIRPRRMKFLTTIVRPLIYVLGAMNRGAVLTVHARKNESEAQGSPGGRPVMVTGAN